MCFRNRINIQKCYYTKSFSEALKAMGTICAAKYENTNRHQRTLEFVCENTPCIILFIGYNDFM